jgi:hypothetical protein
MQTGVDKGGQRAHRAVSASSRAIRQANPYLIKEAIERFPARQRAIQRFRDRGLARQCRSLDFHSFVQVIDRLALQGQRTILPDNESDDPILAT